MKAKTSSRSYRIISAVLKGKDVETNGMQTKFVSSDEVVFQCDCCWRYRKTPAGAFFRDRVHYSPFMEGCCYRDEEEILCHDCFTKYYTVCDNCYYAIPNEEIVVMGNGDDLCKHCVYERNPIGVYVISNTISVLVYDIDHAEDMALAGFAGTEDVRWCPIEHEIDAETEEANLVFKFDDWTIPLNEVMRV